MASGAATGTWTGPSAASGRKASGGRAGAAIAARTAAIEIADRVRRTDKHRQRLLQPKVPTFLRAFLRAWLKAQLRLPWPKMLRPHRLLPTRIARHGGTTAESATGAINAVAVVFETGETTEAPAVAVTLATLGVVPIAVQIRAAGVAMIADGATTGATDLGRTPARPVLHVAGPIRIRRSQH